MGQSKAAIERINPDTIYSLPPISMAVSIVGGKQIELSGMLPLEKDSSVVGVGDLAAQAKKTFENVGLVLTAAGATPADVVRQRVFVTNMQPSERQVILAAFNEFYGENGPRPVSTLIGVQSLVLEEARIEIDVTAVIDA